MTDENSSIEPYKRSPRGGAPDENDPRRCTARKSDGTRERCGRWAVEGLNVCPMHGGRVPAAKRKAQLTLLDLLPLATRKHREILETSTDERVILKATEMVYDRTGLEKASSSSDVTVVREMIVSRLMDLRSGLPDDDPLPPLDEDDDIVEAEIVDEDEPTLEDLL